MTELTLDSVSAIIDEYGALQHPAEALNLLRWLRLGPPHVIIEVGVWRGGNAALLKTFFPNARLIGVDLLGPDDPDEDFVFRAHDIGRHPSLRRVVDTFDVEMVCGASDDPAVLEQVKRKLNGAHATTFSLTRRTTTTASSATLSCGARSRGRSASTTCTTPTCFDSGRRSPAHSTATGRTRCGRRSTGTGSVCC